jgi:RimJ/RimL family protein N-acetyltransferase
MRLEIDLREYIITTIPQYIIEVNLITLNFQELSDEVDAFNNEIKWSEMWTIEDARDRLSNNWRLIVYRPVNAIKGWYWLDNTKEPRNMYVNKHYRGIGVAREMQFMLLNMCKSMGIDRVECSIDDWNLASIKSLYSTGWSEVSYK